MGCRGIPTFKALETLLADWKSLQDIDLAGRCQSVLPVLVPLLRKRWRHTWQDRTKGRAPCAPSVEGRMHSRATRVPAGRGANPRVSRLSLGLTLLAIFSSVILLFQRSGSGRTPTVAKGSGRGVLLSPSRDLSGLPRTYFDIEINGVPKGRIVFALYTDVAPLAAENFRALCTGEKGTVPLDFPLRMGAGKPYWFKGNTFYRIIDEFICQTGTWTESVYGGSFKDDPGGLALKHDRPGLISMAQFGPDNNNGAVFIIMRAWPHLDGKFVIFGEVVRGYEIAEEINAYAAVSTLSLSSSRDLSLSSRKALLDQR